MDREGIPCHSTERTQVQIWDQSPRSIAHALLLDQKNGDHFWRDAIKTELKQINAYKTFR